MDTTPLTLGAFLIGIGLILMLADLVLGSGVMLVLAVGSLVVGIAFVFRYDTMIGIYAMFGVMVAAPALGVLLFKILPYTPLGKILDQPRTVEDPIDLPQFAELRELEGRFGKTLTDLKPAGMVDFEGRRVDSISEGMMIEAGHWVRCVEVRGGTAVVRPADGPRTVDLEITTLN